MSKENSKWLNTNTLVGFTDERGPAWHYRLEDQDEESNHYPEAIPVDDVIRRLFNFTVEDQPFYIRIGDDFVEVPERKAMVRTDNHTVLGVHKEGYQGHDYEEWLLDNWGHILSQSKGELGIGSAGLLRKGAQAWVSIERPDTIEIAAGVKFRPYLLGYSSFDGSLSTGYGDKITLVVCDNTLNAAIREQGNTYRLRHTRHSMLRIAEAREALEIVFKLEDTFKQEVNALLKLKVSDKKWEQFLDIIIPIPELPEDKETTRGVTVANNKRDAINALYKNDERVAPWTGTAFGVLQAFNTYQHHNSQVRGGVPRIIRNMEGAVSGKYGKADKNVLDLLAQVK